MIKRLNELKSARIILYISTLFNILKILCLSLILKYSNRSEMQEFDR